MELLKSFSGLDQDKKRKMRIGFSSSLFIVLTIGVAFAFAAPGSSNKLINASDASVSGNATKSNGGIKFDTTTAPTTTHDMTQMTTKPVNPAPSTSYEANLAKLQASPYRNNLEDNSPFLKTPSAQLPKEQLYGPRSAYGNLGAPAGEGIFRAECEFSHFSYDDPIVYPGQPEAAHLHMNFGNTNTNAYSTYNTIINSGGSTCNGAELNRTAYWAPAVFDGEGNVLVPRRILIYYKSFGKAAGTTIPYPENMQIVAQSTVNVNGSKIDSNVASFQCENHYGGGDNQKQNSIPNCIGGTAADGGQMLFEMNIKFPQCYSGKDPDKYIQSLTVPLNHWWSGNCPSTHPYALPNLEFRIFYDIKPGANTSKWFIASDVDRASGVANPVRGSSVHADWFGGWNKEINATWVKNCNNKPNTDCQNGLLGGNASDPALKLHKEYPTPAPIPAREMLSKLCTSGKQYTKLTDAAYCR